MAFVAAEVGTEFALATTYEVDKTNPSAPHVVVVGPLTLNIVGTPGAPISEGEFRNDTESCILAYDAVFLNAWSVNQSDPDIGTAEYTSATATNLEDPSGVYIDQLAFDEPAFTTYTYIIVSYEGIDPGFPKT